ncbi:hypothetical protein RMATCC62417_06425 [Rhizopus microsporus]|nr:hypothetical protein RMATCC62417_06425 [Rhizopus microsporus]
MNTQFFYEDGQGRVVDEHGVEPMDLTVDEEPFTIETISSRTQFRQNKPSVGDEKNHDVYMELCNKRRYTFYSDDEKTRFFYLFFSKSLSASASMIQLGIHIRAAHRWVKRYYEDSGNIFEKK